MRQTDSLQKKRRKKKRKKKYTERRHAHKQTKKQKQKHRADNERQAVNRSLAKTKHNKVKVAEKVDDITRPQPEQCQRQSCPIDSPVVLVSMRVWLQMLHRNSLLNVPGNHACYTPPQASNGTCYTPPQTSDSIFATAGLLDGTVVFVMMNK